MTVAIGLMPIAIAQDRIRHEAAKEDTKVKPVSGFLFVSDLRAFVVVNPSGL